MKVKVDRSANVCIIEECYDKHHAKGLCTKHYNSFLKKTNERYYNNCREATHKWDKLHQERRRFLNRRWYDNNRSRKIFLNSKHQKRRLQQIKLATPQWADIMELQPIYDNCPPGMTVDHIIPLLSKHVCGLEVPWNLQYLTPEENRLKNNRYEGMPK